MRASAVQLLRMSCRASIKASGANCGIAVAHLQEACYSMDSFTLRLPFMCKNRLLVLVQAIRGASPGVHSISRQLFQHVGQERTIPVAKALEHQGTIVQPWQRVVRATIDDSLTCPSNCLCMLTSLWCFAGQQQQQRASSAAAHAPQRATARCPRQRRCLEVVRPCAAASWTSAAASNGAAAAALPAAEPACSGLSAHLQLWGGQQWCWSREGCTRHEPGADTWGARGSFQQGLRLPEGGCAGGRGGRVSHPARPGQRPILCCGRLCCCSVYAWRSMWPEDAWREPVAWFE